MAPSLSLAAYMAYARRIVSEASPVYPEHPRPDGPLIWAHAADVPRAEALCQIAERLAQLRPGLTMLLTAPADLPRPEGMGATVIWWPLSRDTVSEADAFLSYWRPDICLWTGADLRPALLTCADKAEVPLYLIDAEDEQLGRSGWRWFPDLPRALLRRFSQVQARSEQAARSLRRFGVPDEDIFVTGALRAEVIPLPFNEAEREELSGLLLGRPVWLAARLHLAELAGLIDAQRRVIRHSHRLILVIVPHDPRDIAPVTQQLDEAGLQWINWADGQVPEETTQVILGDPEGELGLWYRIAPMTFLGGSLIPGMKGHDPNEVAVHGSAILYGPNVGRYLSEYTRYAEAGAARIVRDGATMAAAVQSLTAPDQAALMAHAAWDVASQSAEVTDRLLDLVQDTLDVLEES